MSKFNTYAQQLDAAFKTARGEYVEAYQRFQQAQQANCRANVWTPNESAAEKQTMQVSSWATANRPGMWWHLL